MIYFVSKSMLKRLMTHAFMLRSGAGEKLAVLVLLQFQVVYLQFVEVEKGF